MIEVFFSWWILWFVVAIVLFILEIVTSGFLLACFGIGALSSVVVAAIGGSFSWQLGIFSVVSLIATLALRPVMCRYFFRPEGAKTGVDALIGKAFILPKDLNPYTHQEIAISGDVWRMRSETGIIASGVLVEVCGRDGLTLIVRPQVHQEN